MNKKIVMILMAIAIGMVVANAQNANRSGFFMEFGAGSFATTPPVERVSVNFTQSATQTPVTMDRIEHVEYESDMKYVGVIGYRRATSRHWACEIRTEYVFGGRFMAVNIMPGMRYTSREIYKNISLYGGFNAGVAFRLDNTEYNEDIVGAAANVEFGVNLTNKLYIGVFYSAQMLPEHPEYHVYSFSFGTMEERDSYYYYDGNYKGLKYSDIVGLKVGFRF